MDPLQFLQLSIWFFISCLAIALLVLLIFYFYLRYHHHLPHPRSSTSISSDRQWIVSLEESQDSTSITSTFNPPIALKTAEPLKVSTSVTLETIKYPSTSTSHVMAKATFPSPPEAKPTSPSSSE